MLQDMAMRTGYAPAEGVILVDKPRGISSFGVVKAVSRIVGIKKAGHAGTLDPMATGLLVVCLGRATRISRFLMEGFKEYHGIMRLGVVTDTYDAVGKVLDTRPLPSGMSISDIRSETSGFTGELLQSPPPFSAAKHQGKPLYKLARQGKIVHKEPKEIFVKEFSVEDVGLPDVKFRIRCSRGTYVRSLCHDLGAKLGCGAHMTELRRIRCGNLSVDQALTLERLEEIVSEMPVNEFMIPVNEALGHIPALEISNTQARRLRLGQGMVFDDFLDLLEAFLPDIPRTGLVRLVTHSQGKDELVAVARIEPDGRGRLKTEKIWN